MASNIVPDNLDGAFPVAGIDNDSQGFRTNFTNTSTNFTAAKNEIEDLQAKAILKAPLDGESVVDNDMLGEELKSPRFTDARETTFAHGSVSGSVVLDHLNGHYQTLSTTGPITLSFDNFPGTGGDPALGRIRVEMTIADTAHTVTLPASVTNGVDYIDGYVAGVVTFATTGTYVFEIYTLDSTTFTVNDITRRSAPASAGIFNVVEDTSPQLGGDLDVQANSIITSVTNGDIAITPDGIGQVILTSPQLASNLDVQGNSIITSVTDGDITITPNGTGQVVITSPQLGGDLDVQGNSIITSVTDGDITITPDGTGQVILTSALLNGSSELGGDLDVNNNSIMTSVTNGDIILTPDGTGNIVLGSVTIDADQALGAGQDGFIMTYDNGTGLVSLSENNYVTPTATTTELEDITDAINTTALKVAGYMVFNVTTGAPVWAVGDADGSLWNDATGSTAHTPV